MAARGGFALWFAGAIAGSLLAALCYAQTPTGRGRPLTVDDVLEMQDINPPLVAPNGAFAAVEIRAFGGQGESQSADNGLVGITSTVTIVNTQRPDAIRLDAGRGVSLYAPQWSPTGRFLALLGEYPDGKTRLLAWRRPSVHGIVSGRVRVLAAEPIDVGADISSRTEGRIFQWLTDSTILCLTLPADARARSDPFHARVSLDLSDAWRQATDGRHSTASVLESGVGAPTHFSYATIAVISVTTHHRLILGGVPIVSSERELSVAPTRDRAAVISPSDFIRGGQPRPLSLADLAAPSSIGIVDLNRANSLRWVTKQFDQVTPSADTKVAWSPNGRRLAFAARDVSNAGLSTLRVLDIETGSERALAAGGTPMDLAWQLPSKLFVRVLADTSRAKCTATCMASDDVTQHSQVDHWIEVDLAGAAAPITMAVGIDPTPDEFIPISGDTLFGALSGNRIWRVSVHDGSVRASLVPDSSADNLSLIVPTPSAASTQMRDSIIVAAHGGSQLRVYSVNLRSLSAVELAQERTAGDVSATMASTKPAKILFRVRDTSGVQSVISAPHRRLLLTRNLYLAGIHTGERRLLRYRSATGDSLTALLALPVNYDKGRRYPVVVWVYAGAIQSDSESIYLGKRTTQPLNLSILQGQGYCVLIPSIPLADPAPSRLYQPILDAVLPAVQAAVDVGVGDSTRVAVMGHSFGGFTTYALITQTPRFRAAVALAGISDFLSDYGTFSEIDRYAALPEAAIIGNEFWSEGGQGRLGAPPWVNLSAYVENSPVVYADRVSTPVLIIQGDLDYVPVDQGEEFFSAMYRLGKPARFVRYWGEGHVVRSPANVRDMWAEIVHWLSAYL